MQRRIRNGTLVAALLVAGIANAGSVVIRQHEDLSIAPAGDRVADVEANDPGDLPDEPHGSVVVHAADGRVIATYDPCRACRYSDTAWSPEGGGLAFLATDWAAHEATLYVARDGAARAVANVHGTANTVRWSPDGERIAVLATPGAHKLTGAVEAGAALVGEIGSAPDEQRIGIVPAAGGAFRYVSPGDTYVYEFDWIPDGKGFVATAAKGDGDANWWIAALVRVDAESGDLRTIAAPKMQMDLPRVSPDGRTVAFIGGLMSDWGPIGGDVWTVPIEGGEPVDVTPGFRGSFRSIAWRGGRLLGSVLSGENNAIVGIDTRSLMDEWNWTAPVGVHAQDFDGSVVFSADGKVAATVVEDFEHPPEIALGPIAAPVTITHDNAGLGASVQARSVRWKNEGFDVQGWLLGPREPDTKRLHPMVVMVHGGPSSAVTPRYLAASGRHGSSFDFVNALVARGWYVFYPNPRGSYGQGEAFTRANVRDFGGGDLRDILAGVDAVEKIAPVDDARLGLYGHSYGGWMAMWANTKTPRFKAIVAGAGIANWTSYYGQNGIDQWMVPFFGGTLYDDPAPYRAASPIESIRSAKTPTFLYVGERDVECPAPQSLEYWHALKALGTPVQLVIYAGEGHRFRKPENLADLRTRIVGWFAKYLE